MTEAQRAAHGPHAECRRQEREHDDERDDTKNPTASARLRVEAAPGAGKGSVGPIADRCVERVSRTRAHFVFWNVRKLFTQSWKRLCRRLPRVTLREAAREICAAASAPKRPSGMCEAQRVDYIAACERRITWQQYYARWGNSGLTL